MEGEMMEEMKHSEKESEDFDWCISIIERVNYSMKKYQLWL